MNSDSRSFEDDLSTLKADVAVIRSNYVTQADLQAVRLEIQEVRVDLKADIQGVRNELKADIQDVRNELKADIQDVRNELKADIQDGRFETKALETNVISRLDMVKLELKEDISRLMVDNEKLRGEMHQLMAKVHTSLNAQTWRIIGAISSLVAVVYFIVRAGY